MRYVLFWVLFFGGVTGVFGQEEIKFEPSDSLELDSYFGNREYLMAVKHMKSGYINEARPMFIDIMESCKKKEEWNYYTMVAQDYVNTFKGVKNYKEGINFGVSALDLLDTKDLPTNNELNGLYHIIGILYEVAGEIQNAREYFEKELLFLQEHYVLDTTYKFGIVYNSIGITKANSGDLDAGLSDFLLAEQSYLQATDCAKCADQKLGDVYGNIGLVHNYKGDFEKSIIYLNKAIAHGKKRKDIYVTVRDYANLAEFYRLIGEYDLSKEYLNKGLSLKDMGTTNEKLLRNELPGLLFSLGKISLKQNQPLKAFEYFRQVEKILENDTDLKLTLMKAKLYKANCWIQMKEYDRALKYLLLTDSLFTDYAQVSEHKLTTFDSENKQLTAQVFLGKNQTAKARKYLQASLLALPEKSRTHTPMSARIKNQIALTFEREQNLDSALVYIQKSLVDLTVEFDDYNYAGYPEADDIPLGNEIFEILKEKARYCRLKASQEKDNNTKIFFSGLAIKAIDLADRLHSNRLKRQGSLRGHQLKNLLEISLPFYREGLGILADYSDAMQEKEKSEMAFYFTQKMKARQLWATQLGSEAKQLGKVTNDILVKEQQLLVDIQYYEKQVKAAQQRKDSVNIDLYQNQYLFNAKNDYRNLLAEIEQNYPDFFETKFAFNPATLSEIQENLTDDEIILEYTFSDEDYLYLFVIEKNNTPQFLKISIDTQTDKNISRLTKMLRKSSMERNTSREKFIKLSHALYNQFIEPAKEQIAGKKRLIIIGEGKTNYIPFEALVQSDELKSFSDLDYLLTDYEVSYHYSSTLFTKSRKQERINSQSGIFAFAPVYENGLASASSNPMRSSMASDSTFRAFDTEGNFTPLPESEREVNAIADLFKEKGVKRLNIALREEANEENLKSNLQQSYQYVHIAGHSFANIKSPKFSGIACFQEEENTKEDGILYAGEIYNLSTKADLFTLSSCESGFGKLEETEGLLGLNRAFIYAGAPNVTFSLWKIYDKVSAQCMIDFYGEILKDKSYASALRRAKLNLMRKEETASPHYWSPFLLIGR